MNTRAALSGFREDAPKRVLDKLISRRHYAEAEAENLPKHGQTLTQLSGYDERNMCTQALQSIMKSST